MPTIWVFLATPPGITQYNMEQYILNTMHELDIISWISMDIKLNQRKHCNCLRFVTVQAQLLGFSAVGGANLRIHQLFHCYKPWHRLLSICLVKSFGPKKFWSGCGMMLNDLELCVWICQMRMCFIHFRYVVGFGLTDTAGTTKKRVSRRLFKRVIIFPGHWKTPITFAQRAKIRVLR